MWRTHRPKCPWRYLSSRYNSKNLIHIRIDTDLPPLARIQLKHEPWSQSWRPNSPLQRDVHIITDNHRITVTETHDHFDFKSLTRTYQRLIELTTETIKYWQSWFLVTLLTYILALQYWILYQIYQSPYSVDQILPFIDQHLCESLHMIVIMTIWKNSKYVKTYG